MEDTLRNIISEEKIKELFDACKGDAEKLINSQDKIEKLLLKAKEKISSAPVAGNKLAEVPALISLVRHYINKEYDGVSLSSILAIVAALIYLTSSIDLIPDAAPGLGYLDDAAVVACCLKIAGSDVEAYEQWRKENNVAYEL